MYMCGVCVVGFSKVLLSKSSPFPFVGSSPGNAFSKCYQMIRADALWLMSEALKQGKKLIQYRNVF